MSHATLDSRIQNAYERVPYPGAADPESHVRHLQTLATLVGLPVADIRQCRVLELGCASGRNLLPQAAAYPGSRFVGVDASAQQVAFGQELIRELGLTNIELRHVSIRDVDAEWGRFDYIFCPGVWSWVGPETRDKILTICREQLASHGVAVISYNTYPGWYSQGMARDLMRYHVAGVGEPAQQIAQARAILDFLAEHAPAGTAHGLTYRAERDYLRTVSDPYLYHDYLVEQNQPLYFHEFVSLAAARGLQFLTDANLAKLHSTFMPPAVQEVLAHTPLIQQCQLLDFVRNESYHRTVLCQRDAVPERNYRVAVVKRCSVSLVAAPQQAECEIGSHAPFGFAFPQGTLTTTAPLGKAAIRCLLDARPQPLTLEALHAAALARLPDNVRQPADEGDGGLTVLSQAMLGAACAGIARLYLDPPRFRSQIEPFPVATPLARALARRSTYVINQWHENVVLTPLQYLVLSRLDGTHDRDRLLAEAGVSLATGQLQHEGTPESLAAAIDAALGELCGKGLLI